MILSFLKIYFSLSFDGQRMLRYLIIRPNWSYVPFSLSLLDPGNHRPSSHHPGMTPPESLFPVLTAAFCPFPLISSLCLFTFDTRIPLGRQSSLLYLPRSPSSLVLPRLQFHRFHPPPFFSPAFPSPPTRFPSHLNDRLCQSKLKPRLFI